MKDKFYYSDSTTLSFWDKTKILHNENGPAVQLTCPGNQPLGFVINRVMEKYGDPQESKIIDNSTYFYWYLLSNVKYDKSFYLALRHIRHTPYTYEELVSMSIADCKIEREFAISKLRGVI